MTQYSNPANEVTDYPENPQVGIKWDRRTTHREFPLGMHAQGLKGRRYIYVRASGAVATGTCTVNNSTFLCTDAAGNHTADTAFAADEYGWVRETAVDVA